MGWFSKKKSIVEEFNSDIDIPKYLTNATADVWYDLVGVYFIYDIKQEKFIYTINIEDNRDKFKDIAIHLFDNYLVSKEYLLLTPYSEYKNLYKLNSDGSISIAQAKTNFSLDDEQDEVLFYETPFFETKEFGSEKNDNKLDCKKDDVVKVNVSDLDINSKVLGVYSDFETPLFLTDDSKEKFISKFTDWMNAKSRCNSSMITGPANFPVRKARKANNSERNHCDNFYNWREKYFKAVNRTPWKSPEDEQEAAQRKLEQLVNNQIEMKAINVAIRKSKISDLKKLIAHLISLEFNHKLIGLIDNHYARQTGNYKIPSFTLSNNNACIKNTEKKIKNMQTRIERKQTWQDISFDGGYVTIADDRLKIFHDEKPSKEVIQEIKKNGYRWSPFWQAWCRKHTGNAIYSLRFISFIKPHLNVA